MTENKLWKIIDEQFISYYGGYAYLITNGDYMFHVWERKEDAQKVCAKLNEVIQENKRIKQELVQLEEENQGQSDAIDGLQEMMAHYNLEDLND